MYFLKNYKAVACKMVKRQFSSVFLILVYSFFIFFPSPANATISIVSEISNTTIASINDLPARFIPERFSFYGIQGYVVYANPPSACGKVDPPPNPYPPSIEYPINWILLARRSPDCHFQNKIENAQNAGYTAIIIHNVDSNATEIMGVEDPSKIIIYATFVGEYDGQLLKNITYPSEYFIRIQDDFSMNGYLLPFAIVVGLCFIVMIIFMLWQQVVRWIRERRRSRRRKLPSSALKKLPTQKWTKGDPYETCAVCLEDFVEQDKIRVLPCSHGFHQKCIDPWLTKGRRVCPICKRKVVVADERFRDSDSDTDDETAPLLGTSTASNSQHPVSGEGTFVQNGQTSQEVEQESQRPRGRRVLGRQPRASAGSDSSSMTSVSSQSDSSVSGSGYAGVGCQSASHSHSILAEVHHSSEVLRLKIQEIEQQRQTRTNDTQSIHSGQYDSHNRSEGFMNNSSQDNAIYVPEVEYEEGNNSRLENQQRAFSSRFVDAINLDVNQSSTECAESSLPSSSNNPSSNPVV